MQKKQKFMKNINLTWFSGQTQKPTTPKVSGQTKSLKTEWHQIRQLQNSTINIKNQENKFGKVSTECHEVENVLTATAQYVKENE